MGGRADGDLDLSDWLPFTHRLKQGKGSTYAHAEKIPDPVWSYASWGPAGGHAAQPSHAIVARWQAPADMKIDITGTLFRAAADGDGVYGYLSTPSRGIVDRAQASPKDKGQLLGIQGLDVKAGEEVSFIIHCGESTQYDSFQYLPLIYRKGSLVTDFGRDFCGRDAYPLNRERPQPALAQLAQILLMSNEFHFVD